jgi:hypothetical protein
MKKSIALAAGEIGGNRGTGLAEWSPRANLRTTARFSETQTGGASGRDLT